MAEVSCLLGQVTCCEMKNTVCGFCKFWHSNVGTLVCGCMCRMLLAKCFVYVPHRSCVRPQRSLGSPEQSSTGWRRQAQLNMSCAVMMYHCRHGCPVFVLRFVFFFAGN